jgi:hypothetical protein
MVVRIVLLAAFVVASSRVALATGAVKVVPVASAPLKLTGCRYEGVHRYSTVENSTTHRLRSFGVEWDAYDAHGVQLGGGELEYRLDAPLASGASGSYFEDVSVQQLGVRGQVADFHCRLAFASFDSGKRWRRGQPWKEPLVAHAHAPARLASESTPVPEMDEPNGKSTANENRRYDSPVPGAASSGLGIAHVEKLWGDNLPSGVYIHATMMLHGGASDERITSSRFAVIVNVANAGQRVYKGLPAPAPTYQKMNALGQMYDAFTVAPVEDLGSIGSLVVPAGADVRVTVTFGIGGLLANNDIKVALLR